MLGVRSFLDAVRANKLLQITNKSYLNKAFEWFGWCKRNGGRNDQHLRSDRGTYAGLIIVGNGRLMRSLAEQKVMILAMLSGF